MIKDRSDGRDRLTVKVESDLSVDQYAAAERMLAAVILSIRPRVACVHQQLDYMAAQSAVICSGIVAQKRQDRKACPGGGCGG